MCGKVRRREKRFWRGNKEGWKVAYYFETVTLKCPEI